jgi:hypothetical protein
MASMFGGFLAGKWSRVELIGKIVLNLAAVVGMIHLPGRCTGDVWRQRSPFSPVLE